MRHRSMHRRRRWWWRTPLPSWPACCLLAPCLARWRRGSRHRRQRRPAARVRRRTATWTRQTTPIWWARPAHGHCHPVRPPLPLQRLQLTSCRRHRRSHAATRRPAPCQHSQAQTTCVIAWKRWQPHWDTAAACMAAVTLVAAARRQMAWPRGMRAHRWRWLPRCVWRCGLCHREPARMPQRCMPPRRHAWRSGWPWCM